MTIDPILQRRSKDILPIDWTILQTAADGDEAVIKEVVSLYLRQGPKTIKALRIAIARGHRKQVILLTHRFLGSSRFFGAKQIHKPLSALLEMARAERLNAKAIKLLDRVEKEFARIAQFFKAPDA